VHFCSDACPSLGVQLPRRRVIRLTSTIAREYRAKSAAESTSDPDNREGFFALAATWISAAARIEHAARIERSTAAPEIRAAGEPLLRRAAAG
jgi:hypothetical protein